MKNNYQKRCRRSIRLKGYDYSKKGSYFITICIQNRLPLLGKIENKKMRLNEAGKMIQKWYLELPKKFPDIELDEYIIMPDHFHAIINNIGIVRENPSVCPISPASPPISPISLAIQPPACSKNSDTSKLNRLPFDKISSYEKVMDEKVMDEKMMDEKVMDEKVMDEKVMDEKVMDEKMMDEKMMDEKMMDEKILSEKKIGKKI